MAEVHIRKVVKKYDEVVAVRGIDLDIRDHEFVVLVGPSGCGKTTTLRMIAGLEDITDGEIAIGGDVVNDVPPKDRDIAMVFQNYALYPHMTVHENMSFGLRLKKFPKDEINRRVDEAARILDISELLDRKPKQLSGGQRQRVAMGRAIVRNPKVFLFDEPLSNLDAKLRVQMRIEIRRLHNRLKATSIFVTHDQVEAMTLADVVVVMNQGRIEQVGKPTDVYNRPATRFVATFIGSPAMNLVPARVVGPGKAEIAGSGTLRFDPDLFQVAEGTSIEVGIRPEDMSVSATGESTGFVIKPEFVEELGPNRLVHGVAGGEPLVLSVPSSMRDLGNGTIDLHVPVERVHVFDTTTGRALRRG